MVVGSRGMSRPSPRWSVTPREPVDWRVQGVLRRSSRPERSGGRQAANPPGSSNTPEEWTTTGKLGGPGGVTEEQPPGAQRRPTSCESPRLVGRSGGAGHEGKGRSGEVDEAPPD